MSEEQKELRFQVVEIVLADGRRGYFNGLELVKEIEMKLGAVPQLVSVQFAPSYIPKKETEDANKENRQSADNVEKTA